jgi:predicted DsbA family dithiol-disulfide isomerase
LRHLQQASQQTNIPVNLEWMPFMLNPNMPDEGEPIMEHLSKKYGPSAAQRFNDPNSPLRVMGRNVGIEFNNDRKAVNTKRAHALMEYLKSSSGNDVANQFMEDLYKMYFEEGKDINDEAILVEAIGKHGVESEQARRVMAPDFLKDIEEKDKHNKITYGVSGVPFFMIHPNDGKSRPVAFSGAYPVEVIAEQLEEAADV